MKLTIATLAASSLFSTFFVALNPEVIRSATHAQERPDGQKKPEKDDLKHTEDSLKSVLENVQKEKAVLVDVRELVEWNNGHIVGAIHLPWRELQDAPDEEKLLKAIPKDKIVYTHCEVGYRSLRAAKLLKKHGFEIRALKPGYQELVEAGFESEKKD